MKTNLLKRTMLLIFMILCLGSSTLFGNNIRILGVPELVSRTDSTVKIKFGLAWDNSWKTNKPNNHDAAWIFVKCWDGNEWRHVYLNNDSTMHEVTIDGQSEFGTLATGSNKGVNIECGYSQVQLVGADVAEARVKGTVGVFISRKDNGRGNISLPKIYLDWNYVKQGFYADDELAVKVFAVEMVYVPTGDYYLGGVGTESYSFTTGGASVYSPMLVTSEDAIEFSATVAAGNLWTIGSKGAGNAAAAAGTIPDEFPKGYKAFYVMKYELTQEAYADFLNTLDFARQDAHIEASLNAGVVGNSPWNNAANALMAYRQGIVYTKVGAEYQFGCNLNGNTAYDEVTTVSGNTVGTDGQDVAVTFVSFYDLLGYADFAGLRPMTEMEYEKACRGTLYPVGNEYAWGNVFLKIATGAWNSTNSGWTTNRLFTNFRRGDEVITGTGYNASAVFGLTGSTNVPGYNWWAWWWSRGSAYPSPIRVGSFATASSNRQSSGASYWGIMNMSDNVSESCVTPTTAIGREFKGYHGDGMLASNGSPSIAANGWYTSTPTQAYFIPRGIGQFYYMAQTGNVAGASAAVGYNTYYASALGYTTASGPISSRYLTTVAHNYNVRNTLTTGASAVNTSYASTNYMNGIRCVRTQGAER